LVESFHQVGYKLQCYQQLDVHFHIKPLFKGEKCDEMKWTWNKIESLMLGGARIGE